MLGGHIQIPSLELETLGAYIFLVNIRMQKVVCRNGFSTRVVNCKVDMVSVLNTPKD